MSIRSAKAQVLALLLSGMLLLGIYIPVSHHGHESCIFSLPGMSLCNEQLAHLEHWQSTFSAAVWNTIATAIFFAVGFLFALPIDNHSRVAEYVRVRQRRRYRRENYLQELFSSGVLHGRDP